MATVLIHVDTDPGMDARYAAARELVRAIGGRMLLLQNLPVAQFIAIDGFGGTMVAEKLMAEVEASHVAQRGEIAQWLDRDGIEHDWLNYSGEANASLIDATRLCDIMVVSHAVDGEDRTRLAHELSELALKSEIPVLAVPVHHRRGLAFTRAVVAYDGSAEAAHALRAATEVLIHFEHVDVLTVGGRELDQPLEAALGYLSAEGIRAFGQRVERGVRTVEEVIADRVRSDSASLLVMGAYGHGRLREAVFGGVTHYLFSACPVPILTLH